MEHRTREDPRSYEPRETTGNRTVLGRSQVNQPPLIHGSAEAEVRAEEPDPSNESLGEGELCADGEFGTGIPHPSGTEVNSWMTSGYSDPYE